MRRLAIAAALAVGVVAAVWLVLFVWFDDTTTPIRTDDVVEEFRAGVSASQPTPSPVPTEAPAAVVLPEPGVYVYFTGFGSEEIDALGGARHDYPAETTMTVLRSDCGVTIRWDAIEERNETLDLCLVDGDLQLRGYRAYHQFFGQADVQELECDEPILLIPGGSERATASGVCRADGLVEELDVRTGPSTADFVIGGRTIDTIDVDITVTVGPPDGSTTGTSRTTLSFDPETGVLVNWYELTDTQADTVTGLVNYDESFSVMVTSLEPRT